MINKEILISIYWKYDTVIKRGVDFNYVYVYRGDNTTEEWSRLLPVKLYYELISITCSVLGAFIYMVP